MCLVASSPRVGLLGFQLQPETGHPTTNFLFFSTVVVSGTGSAIRSPKASTWALRALTDLYWAADGEVRERVAGMRRGLLGGGGGERLDVVRARLRGDGVAIEHPPEERPRLRPADSEGVKTYSSSDASKSLSISDSWQSSRTARLAAAALLRIVLA